MASSSQSMFGVAVSRVLNCWAKFQFAIEHLFGAEGREKADWLALAIETWIEEIDEPEPYELEGFIDDILNKEFDFLVEGNGGLEVSRLICQFFRLCQENQVAEVQRILQAMPNPAMQHYQQGDDEMVLEEESTVSPNRTSLSSQQHIPSASSQPAATSDDNMEVPEENTDPDGWQVICRKRK